VHEVHWTLLRRPARPLTEVVEAFFCPVGFGCLVRLRFAFRSFAMCRVCVVAPSFVSGWWAFGLFLGMPPGEHAEDGGKGELGCRRNRVSVKMLQRGTWDTPDSMGAERQSRGQTPTNAGHKRHTHTRQAPDTPTHVSKGDQQKGNRGQPQTTSAEGQERPRNGARPDTQVRTFKPDRPKDA
jgi:hypothetical protein